MSGARVRGAAGYRRLLAGLCMAAVFASSCTSSDDSVTPASTPEGTYELEAGHPASVEQGLLTVDFRADAFRSNATVTLEPAEPDVPDVVPVDPLTGAVQITVDADLHADATLTWQLENEPDEPDLVAVLRVADDGTHELLGATVDGTQITATTGEFSRFVVVHFARTLIDGMVERVFEATRAAFDLDRVGPVEAPQCTDPPDAGIWSASAPDTDRVSWCLDTRAGQPVLVIRNARLGVASLSFDAALDVVERTDINISVGRGGRAVVEALNRTDVRDAAVVPRGTELVLGLSAMQPGDQTTVTSRPSGHAGLVDAFELAVSIYLAILSAVGPDKVSEAERALQHLDSTACVAEVVTSADLPDPFAVAGAAFETALTMALDCVSEVFDDILVGALFVTVGSVAAIAVGSVMTLAAAGQGIFDEVTGQAQHHITLRRSTATAAPDTPPRAGCETFHLGFVRDDTAGSDALVLLSRDPNPPGTGYAHPAVTDDVEVVLPHASGRGPEGLQMLADWGQSEVTLLWVCGHPDAIDLVVVAGPDAPAPTYEEPEAEPSAADASWERFWMPSRNVACQHAELGDGEMLRCDIVSGLDPAPNEPCEAGGWFSVALFDSGPAEAVCAGDSVIYGDFAEDGPVLDYGQTWSAGTLQCTSGEDGLACRSRAGHGFELARSGWRVH